ncbi:MAG TPA: hypothetical protein DIC23_20535 [Planctomycetaceae bacterium]|nr:hypothetical protein [Planctomycetaceae bacterium]
MNGRLWLVALMTSLAPTACAIAGGVDPPRQKNVARRIRVAVWFDRQFLQDGTAYRRRAIEFKDSTRRKMRVEVMRRLKRLGTDSHKAVRVDLDRLVDAGTISDLRRYWIFNGFTCTTTAAGLTELKKVAGVEEVFVAGPAGPPRLPPRGTAPSVAALQRAEFNPSRYKRPWYIRYLQADRAWKELGVTGRGTLNVVHDFTFVFSDNVSSTLYRKPGEVPGNGRDDDGNGLVDDAHGFNFDQQNSNLTLVPVADGTFNPRAQQRFHVRGDHLWHRGEGASV